MPNTKSAKKRMRQSARRAARNRTQRSRMKTLVKRVMAAEDADEAVERYREAAAAIDRLGARRVIHPNKAARKKAQLARHVKELGGEP
ncbi:MAG: 30S ribosomal protein S20 [Gemmatimonadota bacterium]